MKTYLLFSYGDYYPAGGINDLLSCFLAPDDDEAKTKVAEMRKKDRERPRHHDSGLTLSEWLSIWHSAESPVFSDNTKLYCIEDGTYREVELPKAGIE
jgi:hypothetical protein